jgi:transcriptional regulator with XRE-family HTH domain
MSKDVRGMAGRNVRRLRIAAGLSQAELAERMGVDRGYVSGLERGQCNPTIVTLWHIAKALAVKVRSLFDEERSARGPYAVAHCPRTELLVLHYVPEAA